MKQKLIIIGGGASGFFAACNIDTEKWEIIILEKSQQCLNKVSISGGGRCNVTHACFENDKLITNYPRGNPELLEVFENFNPSDTIDWFAKYDIEIVEESDGRMFPKSNKSDTIIQCFYQICKEKNINILTQTIVNSIEFNNKWQINTNKDTLECDAILVSTGSSNLFWQQLKKMNIKIVHPVPSLFTFNAENHRLKGLEGISQLAEVTISKTKENMKGQLLITHWGISGPAVLKLSAIAARALNLMDYKFEIAINWLPEYSLKSIFTHLKSLRDTYPKRKLSNMNLFNLPNRLWERLITDFPDIKMAEFGNNMLQKLANELCNFTLNINGKSAFKEEFVTAGGVALDEVNFDNMMSKQYHNLFFAGEVLDIDAVTGGFNFQAAWSSAMQVSKYLNQ